MVVQSQPLFCTYFFFNILSSVLADLSVYVSSDWLELFGAQGLLGRIPRQCLSSEKKRAGWPVNDSWVLNRCHERRRGGFQLWQESGVC